MFRSLIPRSETLPRAWMGFDDEWRDMMDRLLARGPIANGGETALAPRTNVAETEHEFEVTVDIPGMQAKDLAVEYKDGHLWISGHREDVTEKKEGKTFHRIERYEGEFRRVIPLTPVQEDQVNAEYKDGVLTVTLPKLEKGKPHRIAVK